MAACQKGHLELGAHAVCARHQDGLTVGGTIELEQAAKRFDLREDARGEGGACDRLDASDGLVAGIDIDA